MPDFTEYFQQQPESIKNLIKYTIQELRPTQLILFGSRALGDHRENSDFDIAIRGPINLQKWTRFVTELEEKNLSLYPVDLVQLEQLGQDYQKNIKIEGKVIYG